MVNLYKITNQINGKVYIGKTVLTIEQRFKQHKADYIKRELTETRPLYSAFKKYGVDNFTIELIEQVKNDDIACQKEEYWIKQYNSYVGFDNCNGYNATLGGDGKRYYDYKKLAQAFQQLGTIKAVTKQYQCDEKTVRKACEEYNINVPVAPNKRKIKRVSSTGEEKIYLSASEASLDFPNKKPETARKNIVRALKTGGKGYSYTWKYID